MSGHTAAPLRGAFAAYDSQSHIPRPHIVVFQYNPENVSRSLQPQSASGSDQTGLELDTLRVSGPPKETMELSIDLDAADQLEKPGDHPLTVAHGLGPALASLELLMYPKTADVIERRVRLAAGEVQVASLEVPIALLIWGTSRVIPVKFTSLSITEQAFDTNLNPIRAEASVSLDVLSYENLPLLSLGGIASIADHARKESLSLLNTVDASDYLGLLPS